MVAHSRRAPGPREFHTLGTGCSQVRRAPWTSGSWTGSDDEEDDVLHDVVTVTTAVGGVGVLLVMVISGLPPLSAPEPARVRVRAAGRSDGR